MCLAKECKVKKPSFRSFYISENNESLLLNCRAKKMYEILKTSVFYYTNGYALDLVLTASKSRPKE